MLLIYPSREMHQVSVTCCFPKLIKGHAESAYFYVSGDSVEPPFLICNSHLLRFLPDREFEQFLKSKLELLVSLWRYLVGYTDHQRVKGWFPTCLHAASTEPYLC